MPANRTDGVRVRLVASHPSDAIGTDNPHTTLFLLHSSSLENFSTCSLVQVHLSNLGHQSECLGDPTLAEPHSHATALTGASSDSTSVDDRRDGP